jgi:hypothetical protein
LEAAEQVLEVGLAVAQDGRLDLLPPVRGYARAMTPAEPEELDLWCRHFLAQAKALGDQAGKAGSGVLIERLAPEAPKLDAAGRGDRGRTEAFGLSPAHREPSAAVGPEPVSMFAGLDAMQRERGTPPSWRGGRSRSTWPQRQQRKRTSPI